MSGPNHQGSLARPWRKAASRDRAFEGADRGRAHGYDATPSLARRLEGLTRFRRYEERFGCDAMIFNVLGVDSSEGAGADMEHDLGDNHSLRTKPREERFREMKTRRGSRDTAGFFRINRLVPLTVQWSVGSRNVRRKGETT